MWLVHQDRKHEVWSKDGKVIDVYWDLNDQWAMAWDISDIEREQDPQVISLFRLMQDGYTPSSDC